MPAGLPDALLVCPCAAASACGVFRAVLAAALQNDPTSWLCRSLARRATRARGASGGASSNPCCPGARQPRAPNRARSRARCSGSSAKMSPSCERWGGRRSAGERRPGTARGRMCTCAAMPFRGAACKHLQHVLVAQPALPLQLHGQRVFGAGTVLLSLGMTCLSRSELEQILWHCDTAEKAGETPVTARFLPLT